MSRHVWNVQRLSRDTVLRGLYAYCLARNGGDIDAIHEGRVQFGLIRSDLLSLCFAGYVMETTRQQGGGRIIGGSLRDVRGWTRQIWLGTIRSHHRYARGKNRGNYELAGRKMLAAAIRLMYGCSHDGPEIQLGSLLLKLEETGDVLPVLRDYLEENRYEDCLLILEGSFRGFNHATTRPRSEDKPKEAHSDNPPANFTSLFAHCVQR
jgi:hypothetical protein